MQYLDLYHTRYKKVQKALKERNIAACLLTDPIQIRYATGTCMMPLWTAFNYCRYVLVAADSEPTIWEYPEGVFTAKKIWNDVRPCEYWQYRFSGKDANSQAKIWSEHIYEVLKEKGINNEKIGIDSLDFYGHQALTNLGINLCDADEVLQAARKVKTAEEITIMQDTVNITQTALKKFEEKITPGVSEHELLATFWESLLAQGGEWCYTRLIASGERVNPWFQEASSRKVQPGDLVAIDTDVIGLEGYACDISRTFVCGDKFNDEQADLYRYAKEYLTHIQEVMKPGMGHADMMNNLPKVKDSLLAQRYPIFAHGIGMDDEPPFYPFADQKTSAVNADVLEPGMVICIEFYAGQKGGKYGVKLEDQLLITENGSELMNDYPYLI